MMYQRDIVITCSNKLSNARSPLTPTLSRGGEGRRLSEQAQQKFDDAREERVDSEKEESEDDGHDHHHDPGRHRLLAGRPVDLAGLDADLTDEFAGGDFGHFLLAHFWIEKRPADLSGRRGWRAT